MNSNEPRRTPWWKTGLAVALAGAIIPAATFIQGSLQSQKELELQQQQQKQQLRLAYADLMLEGGVERVALLADFLAETEEDPKMRVWAMKQKSAIDQQKREIEERAVKAQAAALEAQAQQAKLEQSLARANAEVDRLKVAEEARQKAVADASSAPEVQRLKELAEQERIKRQAAEAKAKTEETALFMAQSQLAKSKAVSEKSQELLTGKAALRQNAIREQLVLPRK